MNYATVPIGTPIAVYLPPSSANSAVSGTNLETLSDLLDIWETCPPRELAMLRTTSSLLTAFLGKSPDQITIDTVSESRDGFRAYLVSRTYAKNSVRSYVNYVRILLESATALGWKQGTALDREWVGIQEHVTSHECSKIIKHFVHTGKRPAAITTDDTEGWIQGAVEKGLLYRGARRQSNVFWRILLEYGLTTQAPLGAVRKERYGLSMEDMPAGLRSDINQLLHWKLAPFVMDRPNNERIRPVTAKTLREVLCSLAGFAISIYGAKNVTSLPTLITQEIIGKYAEWSLEVRGVKPGTIQHVIGLISGPMTQYPAYKSLDLSWLKTILGALPIEPRSEGKARKAKKYLEYSVIEAIPSTIHAGRSAAAKKGGRHLAKLAQDELMLMWLSILPWRQRNLRECRIGGPTPNLFKGRIAPFSVVDRPTWVVEAERINPNAEFWQFKFSTAETKTDIEVEAILPRQLIGPLEEYLTCFRPQMLKGNNPCNLFINGDGNEMTQQNVTHVISSLTLRYAGRRVTPHLFRDVVAFAWLKEHPGDYLTLSKLLWHSNINTTIHYYGGRFNESSGVVAMENWRTERDARVA